jgi:hypothetical protein
MTAIAPRQCSLGTLRDKPLDFGVSAIRERLTRSRIALTHQNPNIAFNFPESISAAW